MITAIIFLTVPSPRLAIFTWFLSDYEEINVRW
jgi:hypothetical protein